MPGWQSASWQSPRRWARHGMPPPARHDRAGIRCHRTDRAVPDAPEGRCARSSPERSPASRVSQGRPALGRARNCTACGTGAGRLEMRKDARRDLHVGSTLDRLLDADEILDEVEAAAVKRALAGQLTEIMRAR